MVFMCVNGVDNIIQKCTLVVNMYSYLRDV